MVMDSLFHLAATTLVRQGSGCANGEAPAGDGPSPRVPDLTIFRDADGNAVISR